MQFAVSPRRKQITVGIQCPNGGDQRRSRRMLMRRILVRAFCVPGSLEMKVATRVILFAVLSLAMATGASSYGQKSEQSTPQKKLGQHQISQLIASARTPQDHQRLAEYYQEQAQYYLNQSRAYAAKIAAYKRSPYLNSCVMCVTTSYSLEAALRSLRLSKDTAGERADEMHKLAIMHEQIAGIPTLSSMGL
jgi:hypothetical protein